MLRSFTLVAIAVLVAGCTRFGTNPEGGPFVKKPRTKFNPQPAIPLGPPATSSPLSLGSPTLPEVQTTPNSLAIVPQRSPQSDGKVMPAGGVPDTLDTLTAVAAGQILPRRRVDVQPGQLPSPFAPKSQPGTNPLGPPVMPAGGPPTAPSAAANNIADTKKIAEAAAAKWAKTESYEATVTRRELAPNKEMTDDIVQYQFRKEPMAVYIKNIGEAGKGREILYHPTKHGDKIHAIIGKGDENFLYKVGQKAPAVSPDFPLVKSKTRYSIREAGLGTPIARVGGWVAKAESGKIPAENLTFLGEVKRMEYVYPLVGVQLKLRPGDDALLPNGGMRQWFFDPKADSDGYAFPVLIIATEPGGKEVEYYLFEKVKLNVRFTDADFDPSRLGKK